MHKNLQVDNMVKLLKKSLSEMIKETSWMLPEDRRVAVDKLDAIDEYAAYPSWLTNDAVFNAWFEKVNVTLSCILYAIILYL